MRSCSDHSGTGSPVFRMLGRRPCRSAACTSADSRVAGCAVAQAENRPARQASIVVVFFIVILPSRCASRLMGLDSCVRRFLPGEFSFFRRSAFEPPRFAAAPGTGLEWEFARTPPRDQRAEWRGDGRALEEAPLVDIPLGPGNIRENIGSGWGRTAEVGGCCAFFFVRLQLGASCFVVRSLRLQLRLLLG